MCLSTSEWVVLVFMSVPCYSALSQQTEMASQIQPVLHKSVFGPFPRKRPRLNPP